MMAISTVFVNRLSRQAPTGPASLTGPKWPNFFFFEKFSLTTDFTEK